MDILRHVFFFISTLLIENDKYVNYLHSKFNFLNIPKQYELKITNYYLYSYSRETIPHTTKYHNIYSIKNNQTIRYLYNNIIFYI